MRSAAAFGGPVTAAIRRVNDRSFGADGPTFLRVDELHVKEILRHTRFLFLPGAAAVRSAIDAPAARATTSLKKSPAPTPFPFFYRGRPQFFVEYPPPPLPTAQPSRLSKNA